MKSIVKNLIEFSRVARGVDTSTPIQSESHFKPDLGAQNTSQLQAGACFNLLTRRLRQTSPRLALRAAWAWQDSQTERPYFSHFEESGQNNSVVK